jgi:hypothetical protein
MRTIALRPIALTLATLVGAAGAEARTNWQGQAMTIAAPGPVCAAEGEVVGAHFLATFSPANIDDNGPDTDLTFYGSRNAFSLTIPNGNLEDGSRFKAVYITTRGRAITDLRGKILKAKVSPANFDETTPYLNVRVEIKNWSSIVGCTVTLDISFVRRR